MRLIRFTVVLLVFASVCSISLAADLPWSGDWEIRYGQQPDQKPEWNAKGYTPRWRVNWRDQQAPDLEWGDQPNGDCRGWFLLARPVRVPDPAPAQITVEFDYKTMCEMNAPRPRSGAIYAILVSRAAWDALSKKPENAAVLNPGRAGTEFAGAQVHGNRNDAMDWTPSGKFGLTLPGSAKPGDEYLIGIAWGAWHYHCKEAGAMRNMKLGVRTEKERRMAFWNAFDLDRPEMEAMKAAVEKGDEKAAEAALVALMRKLERPCVDDVPTAEPSDNIMKRADETLAGTYRLAGCPTYTFEGPVVWNADPYNYNQWAIALNRHVEWRFVASAYRKTGDARYAKFWSDQVRDWVASMPVIIEPYIEGPYNQPGRPSLSLDAGIRMGQSWFQSFEVFRKAPEVPDAAIVDFVRSCYDHALYLMKPENFRSGSNWGAMESNGLYHIGVLLPEFRDAATWRKTAMDRTHAELNKQVYPDGAQTELTPGYHGVSLRNFLMVMKLARANNEPLPADFVDRMERMFDYYARIVRPNFRAPELNDSGRMNPAAYLREGYELFPKREDFRWMGTMGKEGTPPDYVSTVLPWAGWVIMRGGWNPEATWLLLDAGPFGTGHQHEDKLGILLHAHGHDFLAEGGNYAYDKSKWRKYVLSTRAHNTVRIDGQDQHCRPVRSEHRATEPNQYGFTDSDTYAYARDSHTAGYTGDVGKSVAHRRRVLFVKPDWYIVVDDFAATDRKTHTAETQFIMDLDSAELDTQTMRTLTCPAGPDQARLAIVPLATDALKGRVVKGQEDPEVRGFIPHRFGQFQPVPAAIYEQPFTNSDVQAWALVPYTGDACPLASVEGTRNGATLEATLHFADGSTAKLEATPTKMTYTPATGAAFEAKEDPLRASK